jgi:hypothetical protein
MEANLEQLDDAVLTKISGSGWARSSERPQDMQRTMRPPTR